MQEHGAIALRNTRMTPQKNADTNPTALRGAELLARIDHARSVWQADDAEHPGLDRAGRKTLVVEFLRERPLVPASLLELMNLYALWMALEEPETANAVLHQHRDAALAEHAADTQENLQNALLWGMLELQSRWHFDRDTGRQRLPTLIHQLHRKAEPDNPIWRQDWEGLLRQYQAWDLLDEHLVRQHYRGEHDDMNPESDAALHRRRAKLAFEAGLPERVEEHIRTQIFYLRQVDPGRGIAALMQRWALCARDDVMPLAPRLVEDVIEAARAQLHALNPRPADPVLVECEAQFVRWHARALAEQGRFDEALAIAHGGHFALAGDSSQDEEGRDWFGRWMLEWYVKAGRMEDAAELAWQGIWHLRSDLVIDAYQLALTHCDTDTTTPYWHWILAWAQYCPGLLTTNPTVRHARLGQLPKPPYPIEHYLKRARTIAPDHPMHDLIEGARLADQKRWRRALPLLERGVLALPDYANVRTLRQLWCARFARLSARQCLHRPFPASAGALWCLQIGQWLSAASTPLHKRCDATRRATLAQRYYALARSHFDAFFATGAGNVVNANLTTWSLLYHALATLQRQQGQIDEAIALHRAVLACMPDNRHTLGLLECAHAQDDSAEVIVRAEELWLDLQTHGHATIDAIPPSHYVGRVAHALARAGRHLESSIWIERLQGRKVLYGNRYETLRPWMELLQVYAVAAPAEAGRLLHARLPEILELATSDIDPVSLAHILYSAAYALERCGDARQAATLYQKTLTVARNPAMPAIRQHARAGLARTRPRRWRFWT